PLLHENPRGGTGMFFYVFRGRVGAWPVLGAVVGISATVSISTAAVSASACRSLGLPPHA
ncbi:hypothetical protein, partial [Xanthomonas oryzae]|uniref:hypothetical protein n=1 Tax=Xanthomonas oryzae TaxID=347 RepID=UPI001C533D3B